MLGIVVILILSWILLYLVQRESLLVLGFTPLLRRLTQFALGFVAAGVLCYVSQLLDVWLKGSLWFWNDSITLREILGSFWWDVKSVLTEEFVFRGALLYILIQRLGSKKGIALSAIAFGIYHWFSFGILGSIVPMIFIFIGTGLMGLALAYAFAKSKSILMPIGIHLGWNSIQNTVFSKGPLGEMLFVSSGIVNLEGVSALLHYTFSMILVPILLFLFVRWIVK